PCTIGRISNALISRRLVAHTIAAGGCHSIIVNAYADCVQCITSMPSPASAPLSRLAKKTLLSISRTLGVVDCCGAVLMLAPRANVPGRVLPQSHQEAKAARGHTREAVLSVGSSALTAIRIRHLPAERSVRHCQPAASPRGRSGVAVHSVRPVPVRRRRPLRS